MNTEIVLDHEAVPGGYLVRGLLRITGQAPPAAERPALNLALVLDRSGSMRAMRKLEHAKQAATLLVRRLGEDDVVSIVAYDDEVRTVASRTPGSRREQLLGALAGLETGGMTNLSGGWLRGRGLVADTLVEGGVNRVLLLTDGLVNVGVTEPGQLRDLVGSAAAKGVSTTTIGFGADYDEHLLTALAEAGGGATYYIEHPDQAPAVFEAEIEGLMALAAQNVVVTVSPGRAVEIAAVHHRYPTRSLDHGALRLELGDLYALEPKSLLVELLVRDDVGAPGSNGQDAAGAGAGPRALDRDSLDVATLVVEGYVLTEKGVEQRMVTLPVRVSPAEAGVVEPEVRREMLLLRAARARHEALEDRADGIPGDGARKLRDAAGSIVEAGLADPELDEEAEDLRRMAERFEDDVVTMADAKYMHQRAWARRTSRTSTADMISRVKREKEED